MPGAIMNRLTADERTELARALDRRPELLVVGRGPDGPVAILRDVLAVRRPAGWQFVAWTDIQRGGWRAEPGELFWEMVDASTGAVQLASPGALPQAFAERVRASVVVQRQLSLPGELGTVLLAGRREPGSDAAISWQAEGLGRCNLSDPAVQAHVVAAMAELRAEFDPPA